MDNKVNLKCISIGVIQTKNQQVEDSALRSGDYLGDVKSTPMPLGPLEPLLQALGSLLDPLTAQNNCGLWVTCGETNQTSQYFNIFHTKEISIVDEWVKHILPQGAPILAASRPASVWLWVGANASARTAGVWAVILFDTLTQCDSQAKTRWSPRTRMPTRMLKNRNNTYLTHFPANPLVGHPDVTHWGDTLVGHPSYLTLL